MFKPGDTVLYGSEGVCRVKEITCKRFGDVESEYYVMSPVFNDRCTFFVPTENEKLTSKMHKVLSQNEIMETISSAKADNEWIDDDNQRKKCFKDIIGNGDIKEIISLYKTIKQKEIEFLSLGKKLHKADEATLKESQKIIYEEIALALGTTKEEAEKLLDT